MALAADGRSGCWGAYPVDPVAQRHGVGVGRETRDKAEAYSVLGGRQLVGYDPSWLPTVG